MYFRSRFNSFEEFQRESFDYGDRELGKDELELIEELEAADEFHCPAPSVRKFHARPTRNRWD